MSRKNLDVPNGPAHRADLLGSICDEGPATGVGRATKQTEFLIPVEKHVHDRLR